MERPWDPCPVPQKKVSHGRAVTRRPHRPRCSGAFGGPSCPSVVFKERAEAGCGSLQAQNRRSVQGKPRRVSGSAPMTVREGCRLLWREGRDGTRPCFLPLMARLCTLGTAPPPAGACGPLAQSWVSVEKEEGQCRTSHQFGAKQGQFQGGQSCPGWSPARPACPPPLSPLPPPGTLACSLLHLT